MENHAFKETTPTARKEYNCCACEFISRAWNQPDVDLLLPDERSDYELAKSHKFRILKGDKYIKQPQIYDGEFQVFRGIPAMDSICHKYNLYEE